MSLIVRWYRHATRKKYVFTTATCALITFSVKFIFNSYSSHHNTVNLAEHFSRISLKNLEGTDGEFSASDLWKDNPVVILAIRRPG